MKRRGCGLGCIVAFLGVALSGCLLPHLISSIYALVGSLTVAPQAVPDAGEPIDEPPPPGRVPRQTG